mmetsp:Transcript_27508/g.56598  ORF Transcript_27508/g.56598 Transcript_27508/m.56598 type:complete len:85 (-) Transcript_27508:1224-1478(-)
MAVQYKLLPNWCFVTSHSKTTRSIDQEFALLLFRLQQEWLLMQHSASGKTSKGMVLHRFLPSMDSLGVSPWNQHQAGKKDAADW